ncbi:MAG: NUDIX domain-containing protein, partial [Candidatus Riflebacteria bacterium]|nr:NUDIX domain-containing protein [Candidatus Riflebacteria bacterium]
MLDLLGHTGAVITPRAGSRFAGGVEREGAEDQVEGRARGRDSDPARRRILATSGRLRYNSCHAFPRTRDDLRYRLADLEAQGSGHLLFVIQGDRMLLIHKKKGLGAGKINGPGGRLEPGETPARCAVREVQEELGVTVREPEWAGRLHFQFLDGYSIRGDVFV